MTDDDLSDDGGAWEPVVWPTWVECLLGICAGVVLASLWAYLS